jgi:hypothetical protein
VWSHRKLPKGVRRARGGMPSPDLAGATAKVAAIATSTQKLSPQLPFQPAPRSILSLQQQLESNDKQGSKTDGCGHGEHNRMLAFLGGAPQDLFERVSVLQCRQPSLSNTALKPSGIRGAEPSAGLLHRPHGAPAAPQLQARGPSHGVKTCSSHTHPQPSQRSQFVFTGYFEGKCRPSIGCSGDPGPDPGVPMILPSAAWPTPTPGALTEADEGSVGLVLTPVSAF